MFANQAATAVAAVAAFEEMRFLADNDPLTRLGNRRAFTRRLAEEVHRARALRRSASRSWSSTSTASRPSTTGYGHYAGDRALEAIGDVLRATLRRSDCAFRPRRRRVRG